MKLGCGKRFTCLFSCIVLVLGLGREREVVAMPPAAPSPVLMIGWEQHGRANIGGEDRYARLMDALRTKLGDKIQNSIFPVRRAIATFYQAPKSCFVGVGPREIGLLLPKLAVETTIDSIAIDLVSGHLMTMMPSDPIRTRGDIVGKKVASTLGIASESVFPVDLVAEMTFIRTPDDMSSIKMLKAGRVYAMWGWIPDTLVLAEKEGIKGLLYDETFPVAHFTSHIVCKKFSEFPAFMKELNTVIAQMKISGELAVVLGEHARMVHNNKSSFINRPLLNRFQTFRIKYRPD